MTAVTRHECGHTDERPKIGCCDPWGVTYTCTCDAGPDDRLSHLAGCPAEGSTEWNRAARAAADGPVSS